MQHELDIGRRGLLACGDCVDEIVERLVLLGLILAELLLFRGLLLALVLSKRRSRGAHHQSENADTCEKATESHCLRLPSKNNTNKRVTHNYWPRFAAKSNTR